MGDARTTDLHAASKRSQATLADFMNNLNQTKPAGSPATSDEPTPADNDEEETT